MKALHILPADSWYVVHILPESPYVSVSRLVCWARLVRDGEDVIVGLRSRDGEIVPADQLKPGEQIHDYFHLNDFRTDADLQKYLADVAKYGEYLMTLQESTTNEDPHLPG
ncbi:hypothetical protein [Nitrolancea hollandica]|uniref:Uncharacterized protein n=1 Tax=Nitrolancea hollandica Lb TaxID=1129897 RepID=I4EMD6_9BACT|nr:hypothetical protein [Nitrolancea hollandica]CCF85849.1 hypothetical protein NITHO_5940004 [Nitrolancea hollandica Lb]